MDVTLAAEGHRRSLIDRLNTTVFTRSDPLEQSPSVEGAEEGAHPADEALEQKVYLKDDAARVTAVMHYYRAEIGRWGRFASASFAAFVQFA